MAYLVDSTVWIQFERQGRSPQHIALLVPDEVFAISVISLAELWMGVHRAQNAAQRERAEGFLNSVAQTIPILDFSPEIAPVYARLLAELGMAGLHIGAHDTMIAATAMAYGYGVLTGNVRHFGRIPGLSVRSLDG